MKEELERETRLRCLGNGGYEVDRPPMGLDTAGVVRKGRRSKRGVFNAGGERGVDSSREGGTRLIRLWLGDEGNGPCGRWRGGLREGREGVEDMLYDSIQMEDSR